MNRDCFVVGLFCGGLLCSLLMLLYPMPKACEISVKQGQVTHVYIGEYKE